MSKQKLIQAIKTILFVVIYSTVLILLIPGCAFNHTIETHPIQVYNQEYDMVVHVFKE